MQYEELAREVRELMLENHQDDLNVLNETLRITLAIMITCSGKLEGPQNQVKGFLAARSINSLKCALDLLSIGHYVEPITLTRGAQESWLVSEYINFDPDTAELLLADKPVAGFQRMANRIHPDKKALWINYQNGEGAYSILSSIAHPNNRRALMMAFNPDTGLLRIGPDYHEEHFRITLYYVLDVAMANALVIRELAHDLASHLDVEFQHILSDGLTKLKVILEWAEDKLAE